MYLFSQYAAMSYCNSQNSVGQAITCSGNACPSVTANGATTFKTFTSLLTDNQGLIAVDPTTKLIVVSFRGSHSVRNWISKYAPSPPLSPFPSTNTPPSIVFDFTDCSSLVSGCQAHTGFLAGWLELSASVTAGVAAARKAHPGYAVATAGHSLGGAVATLAAAYLRAAGVPVDIYSYGSPRVGNDAFAAFVTGQAGLEVRVTHLDDPVPKLPPILFGYRHTSPEYWLSTGDAHTTAYTAANVQVCAGTANTNCNAGTGGLDVDAHLYYLGPISACSPSGTPLRLRDGAAPLTDAELAARLDALAAADRQYVASLAPGAVSAA